MRWIVNLVRTLWGEILDSRVIGRAERRAILESLRDPDFVEVARPEPLFSDAQQRYLNQWNRQHRIRSWRVKPSIRYVPVAMMRSQGFRLTRIATSNPRIRVRRGH